MPNYYPTASTALELITADEGFNPRPYADVDATWAVGHGINFFRRGISEFESELLVLRGIHDNMTRLMAARWWTVIGEVRQAVLLNLCHQLGFEGLMEFKEMLAALEHSDFIGAASALRHSKLYSQTPARSERNALRLMTGIL